MKAPFVFCALFAVPFFSLSAADGTWLATPGAPVWGDGLWSDGTRWQGGLPADGVGAEMILQLPTASLAAAPGQMVGGYLIDLDSARTLQKIMLGAGTEWSATRTYRIGGNGTLTFAGTATPSVTTLTKDATVFEIAPATVAGSQGISFSGSGRVHWNPTQNLMTGTLSITSGAVTISRTAALGNMTISMTGGAPRLWVHPGLYDADLEITNEIILSVDGVQNAGITWAAASARTVTLSGVIKQSNPTATSEFRYLSNTGGGQQRYIVSGDNRYQGGTVIGGGTTNVLVLARHNNALGVGEGAAVGLGSATAALGLAGNIVIADKRLTLNGSGYSGVGFESIGWAGSLFNHSGENEWSGEVSLGMTAAPTIGVAAGSRLLLSGVVEGAAAQGLQKVGSGELVLSGHNLHSSGTTVHEGRLLAAHDNALGTGPVAIGNGATLSIASGVVVEISTLHLDEHATLSFSLNGSFAATGILLSGAQTGTDTFSLSILDGGGLSDGIYTLLQAGHGAEANGFQLASIADGYTGTLYWEDGLLTLQVSSIPEPGSCLLLGSVLAMALITRKRFS